MLTYKLQNKDGVTISVLRSDGWCIPVNPENTDYQQFKKDIANGVELQDENGTAMTAEQVTSFLTTLP